MIEPRCRDLSIRRQCGLLDVSRSAWYQARNRSVSDRDTDTMKRIDRIYTEWPWYGSRRVAAQLRREGRRVSRKRVQRLMRTMGIAGAAPKRATSRPERSHPVYPYLLRNLTVNRPNQVWCADITYIPLDKGHMYLVAIMDWYSRYVLSWALSNSLDSSFCVEALQDTLASHGTPEIFNTDQGCQFTSADFTTVLRQAGVRISMDGRGRWMDNVFIERLWRSVKHEDIYFRGYETATELYRGLIRYFRYYNEQRPHQSLDDRTPAEVHANPVPTPTNAEGGGEQPALSAAPTNLMSILAAGGLPPAPKTENHSTLDPLVGGP